VDDQQEFYQDDDLYQLNQNEANDYSDEGPVEQEQEDLTETEARIMEYARDGFFQTLPL